MTDATRVDDPKPSVSEDVKQIAHDTKATVDAGLSTAAHELALAAANTQRALSETYGSALELLDQAQVFVDHGVATYKTAENAAVKYVKGAVAYTIAYPELSYPAFAAAGLLALPGTRRFLWRNTLGRFVTPESVLRSSQSRVDTLKGRVVDYGAQVDKLEQRLVLAEEELTRGYSKLKATRLELQRLAGVVSGSQNTAQGVVRDLRDFKKLDASLALRAEAAQQAALLKAQKARIDKGIHRIASRDI